MGQLGPKVPMLVSYLGWGLSSCLTLPGACCSVPAPPCCIAGIQGLEGPINGQDWGSWSSHFDTPLRAERSRAWVVLGIEMYSFGRASFGDSLLEPLWIWNNFSAHFSIPVLLILQITRWQAKTLLRKEDVRSEQQHRSSSQQSCCR